MYQVNFLIYIYIYQALRKLGEECMRPLCTVFTNSFESMMIIIIFKSLVLEQIFYYLDSLLPTTPSDEPWRS